MGEHDSDASSTGDLSIPDSYTVTSAVEGHADDVGDRVAVRFLNDAGVRTERTYAALRDDMHRFANGLEELGIGRGDRVMHLLPRHPDVFAVQLGALSVGALLVPCSAMLQPRDIEFRATDCGASTIVVHKSLTDMVEPVLEESPLERVIVLDGDDVADERWTTYDAVVDGESTVYEGPDIGAANPMSINYTSGTTGKPKPVLHRHRWLYCFTAVNARHWWGIDEETDLDEELLWATTGTGWAKWFWSPIGVGLTTGASQFV